MKLGWLGLAVPFAVDCSGHVSSATGVGSGTISGSGSSSGSSGGGDDSGTVGCATNPGPYPIDTYTANLMRAGTSGILTFELVKSDPAPPEQGFNAFTVKVTHSDGTPFTGELDIPPKGIWMPAHAHGPSVVPIIHFDASQNAYTVSQVDLFMPGVWRITFDAHETSGATTDAAVSLDDAAAPDAGISVSDESVFYFCLD
jgi:YtkA-like protein